MKKLLKVLALLLAMGLCFLAGWRIMPRVWPTIKEQVVYAVFPQMKPTPAPVVTPKPYMPESSGTWEEAVAADDSLVYYFYKEHCPYCVNLEPLMAGLPASITLPDGTVSTVKLVCLNKNETEMAAVIADYYAANAVPEEKQYVPAVVIGDAHMMPGQEIIDGLMDALMAGDGLHTPLLNGTERIP